IEGQRLSFCVSAQNPPAVFGGLVYRHESGGSPGDNNQSTQLRFHPVLGLVRTEADSLVDQTSFHSSFEIGSNGGFNPPGFENDGLYLNYTIQQQAGTNYNYARAFSVGGSYKNQDSLYQGKAGRWSIDLSRSPNTNTDLAAGG